MESREPGTGRRLIEIEFSETSSKLSQPSQQAQTVVEELAKNEANTQVCDGCDDSDSSSRPATVSKARIGMEEEL